MSSRRATKRQRASGDRRMVPQAPPPAPVPVPPGYVCPAFLDGSDYSDIPDDELFVLTDPGCSSEAHRFEVFGATMAWESGARWYDSTRMDCGCILTPLNQPAVGSQHRERWEQEMRGGVG